MKDQMLEDKYNELGKAHAEAMNQLAKKDEIIKELKRLYFYADIKNWQTPESQGFRVDDFCLGVADMIEEIDSRDSDYGGNLAREVKKKIEILENGK